MTEYEQNREYLAISHLVGALSTLCAASPEVVIDQLTGLLWSEEEAASIKSALEP